MNQVRQSSWAKTLRQRETAAVARIRPITLRAVRMRLTHCEPAARADSEAAGACRFATRAAPSGKEVVTT